MSQPTCQKNRDLEAQRRAAAILAQSHQEPPLPQEPASMDRVLEELTRQNQLLVELLGAVNALTAATLSIRSRFVGEE